MNTLIDILKIAFSGIEKLSIKDFYLTIIGGIIFSILVGLSCHYFYKLWNKNYKTKTLHKILSVFSFVFSFLFIICFVGFTFLEEIAMANIVTWKENLQVDSDFKHQSFIQAYENVNKLGIEDFSNITPPDKGGNSFPTKETESQLEAGKTYYEAAILNFKNNHGFLNSILSVKSESTLALVQKDMTDFFAKGNKVYMIDDGIQIAANSLKDSLFEQAPRVVKVSRILLVILFVFVQLIPFSIISYSAYKDLRIQS